MRGLLRAAPIAQGHQGFQLGHPRELQSDQPRAARQQAPRLQELQTYLELSGLK